MKALHLVWSGSVLMEVGEAYRRVVLTLYKRDGEFWMTHGERHNPKRTTTGQTDLETAKAICLTIARLEA